MDKKFDDRNSGAIFQRQKRSPNSPDYGGQITLGEDLIEYLNECIANRQPAVIDIACWAKQSRSNGKRFLSVKVDKPFEKTQGRGGYQQGSGYGRQEDTRGFRQESFNGQQESFGGYGREERRQPERIKFESGYKKQGGGRYDGPIEDDEIPF